MLTTFSPSTTQANRVHRFLHMLHCMPDTTNMYGGNGHLMTHTCQELKIEDIPITQHH